MGIYDQGMSTAKLPPTPPKRLRRGLLLAVSVDRDLYDGLAGEADEAALSLPDYIRHVLRGCRPPLAAGAGHWLDLTLRSQLWMAAQSIAHEPHDHHNTVCPACASADGLRQRLPPIDMPRAARTGLRLGRKPQIRATVSAKRYALIVSRSRRAGCSVTDYVREILCRRQRPIHVDFQSAIDALSARAWIDSLRFWLLAATEDTICSSCRRARSTRLGQIVRSTPAWPETRSLLEVLDA